MSLDPNNSPWETAETQTSRMRPKSAGEAGCGHETGRKHREGERPSVLLPVARRRHAAGGTIAWINRGRQIPVILHCSQAEFCPNNSSKSSALRVLRSCSQA